MHFNDIENAYTNHQYPDAECMLADTNNVPDSLFTPEGVKLIPKRVSENGTYYASQDGANGYDEVIVDVEGGATPVLRPLVCSYNGTFTPPEGVDGFDVVTTNIHPANPYVGNFTENQTIHVDGEYNGVDITVDVDAITNELTVTENGTYTPPSGVDGFSEVVVNVPATEPDIPLNKAQISSVNNKYMGAILTNTPISSGYYAISFYHSDQIAGGTNLALVKIESLPSTITLGGLSNFRLNVTTNSVEVDNYDGSAKDVYMSIMKIPDNAICVKPDGN